MLCSPLPLQVVAFVKGTRQQPQCGFSARMLSILTTLKTDFEVRHYNRHTKGMSWMHKLLQYATPGYMRGSQT